MKNFGFGVMMAALAGTASAIGGDLSLVPAAPVIMPGGSVQVNAFGRFPASGFALASVEMDVNATLKGWGFASSGVLAGADVLGASWSQPHMPFGGPVANPANPIRVWNGQFTPDSYAPGVVTFGASVGEFEYYPSALTPSTAPATPRVWPGHVLVNPVAIAGTLAAPGPGTTMEPVGPTGLAAETTGPEAILVGMLLPAIQKVRDAASRSQGTFTLTFQGQTTAPASPDPVPTESLSLNFDTLGPVCNVVATRPGAMKTEICTRASSGVFVCLIHNQSEGASFTLDHAPDTHQVETRYDPISGEYIMIIMLTFDEPVVATAGSMTAPQTVALRIVSTSSYAGGLVVDPTNPNVVYIGGSRRVLSLEVEPVCRPDMTSTAVPGSPAYGFPDGRVNNDDFFYFLAQFAAGNTAEADLTAGAVAGQPGYGVPNGSITNDDFFFYLALFSQGC